MWVSTAGFNADSKTYGSFGVIYHRDTFQPIIDWTNHAPTEPFDHIYPSLVRAASCKHECIFHHPNRLFPPISP